MRHASNLPTLCCFTYSKETLELLQGMSYHIFCWMYLVIIYLFKQDKLLYTTHTVDLMLSYKIHSFYYYKSNVTSSWYSVVCDQWYAKYLNLVHKGIHLHSKHIIHTIIQQELTSLPQLIAKVRTFTIRTRARILKHNIIR